MRNYMKTIWILVAAASLALAGCSDNDNTPAAPGVTNPNGITATAIDDANPATAPGVFAVPAAINDGNQIVGTAEAAAGAALQPAFWLVDNEGAATVAPTALATIFPGGFAAAHDINSTGVIVGMAANTDTSIHAVVWANKDAAPTLLQSLSPGGFAAAYGINDNGRIVGTAENGDGLLQAVRWQRDAGGTVTGPFVLSGVPAGWEAEAYKVNADGTIAGELISTEGISSAVIWQLVADAYVRLDLPGVAGLEHAMALDLASTAAGTPLLVVGEVADAGLGGLTQAVRWTIDGVVVTRTTLGSAGHSSSAAAVNTAGRAAGWENSTSTVSQATVWGNPTGKTTLISTNSQAFDLNNNNLVVGRNGSQGFVKLAN